MKSEVVAHNPKPKRDTSKASAASAVVHAQKKADRERGRQQDRTLQPEISVLIDQARQNYSSKRPDNSTPSDFGRIEMLIIQGKYILRAIAYRKISIQALEQWDIEDDAELPFEKQIYNHLFIDAACHDIVETAQALHLTPELAAFEVKVLEAAVPWMQQNPDNIEWLDEIKTELVARQRGEDTYHPVRRPVGRPPKAVKNSERPQPFVRDRYV